MRDKRFLRNLLMVAVVVFGLTLALITAIGATQKTLQAESVAVKPVSSEITADGTIHSESEAQLHFQIAGLLTALPFKEGDRVSQGQTIAQLDTYTLQKQAQAAANAYQSAQDVTSQTASNQQSGVLEGQTRSSLDATNRDGYSGTTEVSVIADAVKRIVDESQLTQNTASLNLQIAQYAQTLGTLSAPFSGIVTHMDVSTPKVNVTPTTTFSIADPNALVFRANVSAADIDFVSTGARVTVHIDGSRSQSFIGKVERIYPTKTTLASGIDVYPVDIVSDQFASIAKLGQTGSVTIDSNSDQSMSLVPSWTVLSNSHIWVLNDNKPVLRTITTGKTHGDMTEVLSGLTPDDRIITNPYSLARQFYSFL